jgi:cell division protein FtsI (penicillin-binding protein 3)
VLTLFAGRLVQIQGMESGYYRKLALSEKLKTIPLPAMRGTIYGANGQILAMTVATYTVWADPPQILAADKPTVAQQLAGPLGLPAAKILNLLEHPSSKDYVQLATKVSATNDATIAALKVFGAGIYNDDSPNYTMAYPDGDATANVVGFTNTNASGVLTGQAGLEQEYNKQLTGTTGSEQVEKGADGEPIPLAGSQDTPARNGESIKLTIIPALQLQAQQACQQEMRKSLAKQCTVVIIQPTTGDILAMAQYPTYSRTPGIENVADTANLDVQSQFTPGSTAKVITAAAALEHGGQTPMSSYSIPYQIFRGGQSIRDAEWSYGEDYTIAGIIANSSNVGMSKVVAHVSPQIQYDYLKAFGLDQPTGLNLPGETQGQLPALKGWAADERYTLSYGQGIAVNAVQMASVYATIANGGVRVQPRLIAGTYNAAGQYTPAPPSKSRRVIAAKTAKELISILQQVPGVDQQANEPWGIIPGYAVASKTGTANEPGPRCPPATDPLCVYGASYIGMAPGNDPQVVVAVNVQNPDKSHQSYFGDMVAGPVFYSAMLNTISALQIQPQPGLVPPYVRLNAR